MTQIDQPTVPNLRFPDFKEKWEPEQLGKLMEIKSASRVHKDDWRETGVPFFRSSDVVSAFKGNENKKAYISHTLFEKLAAKSGKVNRGDLLVTGGGSIGIPYLIQSNAPLYFKDADLLWLRNSGKVDGCYLYAFFCGPIFRRYVQSITHIGTISHYTIEQAKVTPINLPTLPEQRKIAGFLGAVDTKIAQLAEKKRLLEDYKKGCMQQLFSQKIRFKDNTGNHFPDWEEKRLGEVVQFSKGKGISKADITEGGQTACIRYGEIYTLYREHITDVRSATSENATELSLSEARDVIIPASGEDPLDMARACCVEDAGVALGGDINILRGAEDGVFLAYYLNNAKQREIASYAQGNSVVHLYGSQLRNLSIFLPQPGEQRKIAGFLSALDTKINLVAQELEQARTFKRGLLQQMFV